MRIAVATPRCSCVAALLIPLAAMTAAPPVAGPRLAPAATCRRCRGAGDTDDAATAHDNPFLPAGPQPVGLHRRGPQPGCGSKARGGWRQWLTFVIGALAIAFVGWRIVVRRAPQPPGGGRRPEEPAQWTALSSGSVATS